MSVEGIAESVTPFWEDVRRAREEAGDGPLRLRPAPVCRFDRGRWDFLKPAERGCLQDAVGTFLDVARRTVEGEPVADAEPVAARSAFGAIERILQPEKHADPLALVVGKSIEAEIRHGLPPWVIDYRIRTGEDWTGRTGVWIWVFAEDRLFADRDAIDWETFRPVRRLFLDALENHAVDLRSRIDFAASSERAMLGYA